MWPSPPFFFEPTLSLSFYSFDSSNRKRWLTGPPPVKTFTLVKNSMAVALPITNVNSASSRLSPVSQLTNIFPWDFSAGVFAIRRGDRQEKPVEW